MNKIRTTATKATLAAAIAGGSIVGLAGMTGIADAADDTATETATELATELATDTAAPAAALVGEDGDVPADDTDRSERRAARHEAREANRQEIADVLGITVEDLGEQLEADATLADIAEANGVDIADVVDVIVQQKTERIDLAVENGRITTEEAAEKTADLDERVQTRVEEG
ncbi:MAG: hypothetical protein WA964_01130, partial [Ilumatobacter sp.]